MNGPDPRADLPTSRRLIIIHGCVILFLLALIGGAWFLYKAISISLQAEETLHATLFIVRLVEEHVQTQGRWPTSWDDLEKTPMSPEPPVPRHGHSPVTGAQRYAWPEASSKLRVLVVIDFDANPITIASQPIMSFQAIRPIGPHYEFRDYGFVDSLIRTLREKGLATAP